MPLLRSKVHSLIQQNCRRPPLTRPSALQCRSEGGSRESGHRRRGRYGPRSLWQDERRGTGNKKKKCHASPREAVDLVTAAPFDRLLQPSCLSRPEKKTKKKQTNMLKNCTDSIVHRRRLNGGRSQRVTPDSKQIGLCCRRKRVNRRGKKMHILINVWVKKKKNRKKEIASSVYEKNTRVTWMVAEYLDGIKI